MDVVKADIMIAWTNTRVAYGTDRESVIEALFEDGRELEPFRVSTLSVELPLVESGDVSVSLASDDALKFSPRLRLVGGTDGP